MSNREDTEATGGVLSGGGGAKTQQQAMAGYNV